ncbi:MAG: BlaI/MecI/CopY family transcriptional regulator, partial [Pseudomonadota bacterium]
MQISDAELDVMKILWASPGISATDVHDALLQRKDWSVRTVKTLLARQVIAKSGGNNAVSASRSAIRGPVTRKSQLKKLG